MTTMNHPIVATQMLTRKPANVVFEAFINPEITVNFWFTRSDGILGAGKPYGVIGK